jgi:hypothetical protein
MLKIIFTAECAGTKEYRITPSTKLGPSNEVVTVKILDTGYATGKEAHDNLTVSHFLNVL